MHDIDDPRAILRRVAAYKELCDRVRRSATGGLVFGGLMLLLWYLMPPALKFKTFGLIYLGLAALEFTAALWNKFAPAAEGILLDGVVLLVFGGMNLVRQYLLWNGQLPGQGHPSPLWALFGVWMLLQGVGHVRSYFAVRRAFGALRPTHEHLRWYSELIQDVRNADPTDDPTALDLPTRPPLRGKLLGDTAVFLPPNGEVIVAAREDVEFDVDADEEGRPPAAHLWVEGENLGRFTLDPDNWRNYSAWKSAGGQEPEPPLVRPKRRSNES